MASIAHGMVAYMTLDHVRSVLAEHRSELLERYGVSRIAVFGSRARGEATPLSDVDILAELERPVGWEIVGLHRYLESLLGLKVDLLTTGAVKRNALLWESIQDDLVYA